MAKTGQPIVGIDSIIYVDEHGQEYPALVTNEFGGPNRDEEWSINLVYVDPSDGATDQYGRQLIRKSSVPPKRHQSAHGNYWKWPE